MTRLAIIVPVLGRAHRVGPLLLSIAQGTTGVPHRVLFVCDASDEATIDAVQAAQAGLAIVADGTCYARKVNQGIAVTTEQHVFTAADDLAFRPGWYEAAVALMRPPVSVVGVNDLASRRGGAGGDPSPVLLRRPLVPPRPGGGPGGGLHEGYRHNFPDDELVHTARSRGAIAFATDSIVEHLHPHYGKGEDDDTYRIGRASFHDDRQTFRRRRAVHGWA